MNGKQKLFLLILGTLMIAFAVRFGLNMLGDDIKFEDNNKEKEMVEIKKEEEN